MSPFEFMNVNDAKEMLNSRHVGGIKRRKTRKTRKTRRNRRTKAGGSATFLINTCGPGSCGGSRGNRRNKKKSLKN
jgi:hypothetical protein